MRVMVTSTPGSGHVLPLVPLARALQASGHQVLWATGPDAQQLVSAAGLRVVPAGIDQPTRMQQFRQGWPHAASLAPRSRRAVMFPALFATLSAQRMFDDLTVVADDHRPDLIIHEPCELAAAPQAHRLGIPHATVGFGRLVPPPLLASAASELTDLWSSAGLDVPEDLGLYEFAYFHPLPDSLEPRPAGRPIYLMRPLGYDGSDEPVESTPADRRDRRSVYVTFGTEFGPAAPWRTVLDAIDGLAVDALLTVGGAVDPSSLGPLPPGVRVERWVPQRRALAGSDLVLSHGGSGALIGAASAGLGHLALPMAADHFDNADLIADKGIGMALEPAEASTERIADAIAHLVDDGTTRANAQAAAADIAAMPGPDEAVPVLERLVDQANSAP